MQAEFYLDKLYPLQDKILSAFNKVQSKFYLTGGTALSRCFTHHRFSDDLDFFLNADLSFKEEVSLILDTLKPEHEYEVINQYEDFVRLKIVDRQCELKVDMINDIDFHSGGFESDKIYYKIDHPLNILSNKLCALSRGEPKDVADIIALASFVSYDWKKIVSDAKMKDTWVNEIEIALLLDNYDVNLLQTIKWIKKPNLDEQDKILKIIAKDILSGGLNSLILIN